MNADRVLDDLRELARLTGGPDGARRVCWTDEWARAREFLRSRLEDLPVEIEIDEAGNLWAGLEGEQEGFVIVGSHIDSVPACGWLDGALGELSALEALRSQAEQGKPPVSGLFIQSINEVIDHDTAVMSARIPAPISTLRPHRGVSAATTSIGMPIPATANSTFAGISVIPASSGDK